MKPWPLLTAAILAEAVGTSALKASDGLTRWTPRRWLASPGSSAAWC